MTPDRESVARAAVAATGLVVDPSQPGALPSIEDLFVACEMAGVEPPDELLELVPTGLLLQFGYGVSGG
jgi:hypothetical protein